MRFLLFIGVALACRSFAASAPPSDAGLPQELQLEISRLEASARRSAVFRQLLAETDGLSRRVAGLPPPIFFQYEAPPLDRLVFYPARLKSATEWEFQVAEARELARASMGLPIVVLEAELAAYQKELAFALELAYIDPGFSKEWAARARKAKADADVLRQLETWARARLPQAKEEPPPRVLAGELDRLAVFAALLAEGPERFYAVAERVLPLPAEMVRLAELEDFLVLHAPEVKALSPKPDEAYVRVGGRRYPAFVVRAAQTMLPLGGAARVKEAIGPADVQARELSIKLRRWLKWPEP